MLDVWLLFRRQFRKKADLCICLAQVLSICIHKQTAWVFVQETEYINPEAGVLPLGFLNTQWWTATPSEVSHEGRTTVARYQRGSSSVNPSGKARQLAQPFGCVCPPSFLENSPVKPSPQNKWLEPTHFKLQGRGNQKMLSCFSQLVF